MPKLQLSTRRLRAIAGCILLGAMLAACGHSNSTPPAPAPSPVAQFISFVMSIVNKGAADTEEPDATVSGILPATSETDEPVSL